MVQKSGWSEWPRHCAHYWRWGLSLETNLFGLVGAALQGMGHQIRSVTGVAVGGYPGILFTRDTRLPAPTFDSRATELDLPVNGVYRAGSDHRKDGEAVGW